MLASFLSALAGLVGTWVGTQLVRRFPENPLVIFLYHLGPQTKGEKNT